MDTGSLFLVVIGGMYSAISFGTLPGEGDATGYSMVYLRHPYYFHLGLIAVVVGFIWQLWDNLTRVHKLSERKVFWSLTVAGISLLILALGA